MELNFYVGSLVSDGGVIDKLYSGYSKVDSGIRKGVFKLASEARDIGLTDPGVSTVWFMSCDVEENTVIFKLREGSTDREYLKVISSGGGYQLALYGSSGKVGYLDYVYGEGIWADIHIDRVNNKVHVRFGTFSGKEGSYTFSVSNRYMYQHIDCVGNSGSVYLYHLGEFRDTGGDDEYFGTLYEIVNRAGLSYTYRQSVTSYDVNIVGGDNNINISISDMMSIIYYMKASTVATLYYGDGLSNSITFGSGGLIYVASLLINDNIIIRSSGGTVECKSIGIMNIPGGGVDSSHIEYFCGRTNRGRIVLGGGLVSGESIVSGWVCKNIDWIRSLYGGDTEIREVVLSIENEFRNKFLLGCIDTLNIGASRIVGRDMGVVSYKSLIGGGNISRGGIFVIDTRTGADGKASGYLDGSEASKYYLMNAGSTLVTIKAFR